MDFDILSYPPDLSGDGEAVETGLSAGEMRQSLLDRVRSELDGGRVRSLNHSLRPFAMRIPRSAVATEAGKAEVNTKVEDLLYGLSDERLVNSTWWFPSETIVVKEAS